MTAEHTEEHHGPNVMTYLMIFAILSVCTAISFIIYEAFGKDNLKGAGLIMFIAVIKATLVGAVFMHLKYDWFKLYFVICPVFIMATMMVVVLLPDNVLAWHREAEEDSVRVKVVPKHRPPAESRPSEPRPAEPAEPRP